MKKTLVFCLFFMLILAGKVYSQSILKNEILKNQLKDYETYIRQFVAQYKIKEFLITVNHRADNTFELHAIFYTSEAEKFRPTDLFRFGGMPVLVHDEIGNSKEMSAHQDTAIDQKYFKTFVRKEDSLKTESAKIAIDAQKRGLPLLEPVGNGDTIDLRKARIIDTSIYPDIPVIPSSWTLKIDGDKLVSKFVSKQYAQQ